MVAAGASMSPSDRAELIASAVSEFRNGEIGPLQFDATLSALGCNATEIRGLAREHRDDYERNRKSAGAV